MPGGISAVGFFAAVADSARGRRRASSLRSKRPPSPPANDRCARAKIPRPFGSPESPPNGKRWSVSSVMTGNSLVFFDNLRDVFPRFLVCVCGGD